MSTPAIVLIIVNVGLLWLLMAAPVGIRTIRLRRHFDVQPGRVWQAIYPLGSDANWHPSVIDSQPLGENRIRRSHTSLDRNGRPIQVTYEVSACNDGVEFSSRVVEDTALDPSFWRNYTERHLLEHNEGGTDLLVEQTDKYRGLAFLIFRYFRLRRELDSLGHWLATGKSSETGLFEKPLTQAAIAILSTLMLWPFFGPNAHGLMLSSILTLVIVAHEFGHMAAYRAFGHQRVRMIFVPLLGGIAIGGRPYNSHFEIAVCALMGAGMSGFLVPVIIGAHNITGWPVVPGWMDYPLLLALLILGAFNLLNLLPMNRFDGGQVLRQIFRSRWQLTLGSFLIAVIILFTGWQIGLPRNALLAGLAVFSLLSLIGQGGVKPRHELLPMSNGERLMSAMGLLAAVSIHAYAVAYASERLFNI